MQYSIVNHSTIMISWNKTEAIILEQMVLRDNRVIPVAAILGWSRKGAQVGSA